MRAPRTANLISGTVVLAVGTWIWFFSRGFPTLRDGYPGPALFPGILAVLLVICGVALIGEALYRPAKLVSEARGIRLQPLRLVEVGAVVALGLLYPTLQAYVGFVPTSALLIFGVAMILRARWIIALPVAILGAATIYFAFTRLLGVPL